MGRHAGSDRLKGRDQLVELCRMNDALNQFHSASRMYVPKVYQLTEPSEFGKAHKKDKESRTVRGTAEVRIVVSALLSVGYANA
jgi:hypothetical protein